MSRTLFIVLAVLALILSASAQSLSSSSSAPSLSSSSGSSSAAASTGKSSSTAAMAGSAGSSSSSAAATNATIASSTAAGITGASNTTAASSSAAAAASNSSSAAAAASSSSGSSASSSTGAASLPVVAGSVAVVFSVNMPPNVTAAVAVPKIHDDISDNIAGQSNTTAAAVGPYIEVTSYNGVAVGNNRRRLLQTAVSTPVTFIILGSIAQLGISTTSNVTSLVQTFQQAAAAGTLTASNAATVGGSIPAQNITVFVPSIPTSSSSSTAGAQQGGAAAVASATSALLFAAVASLALLL